MFDSARKSLQPSKTSDECLLAMKEDLAAWLNSLYELNIDIAEAESGLLDHLETGVLLCRHANAVSDVIIKDGKHSKEYNVLTKGKSTDTDDITSHEVALQYRSSAKPETFQARDNIATFLWWCRDGCLQLDDVITFETEDLVKRRNERNVVLCLLEVARRGARFGMQAPDLVRLEEEIDAEIALGGAEGSMEYDKDELVARLLAWRAEMERDKREWREQSPRDSSRDSGKCTRESEDDTISSSRHDRDESCDLFSVDEEVSGSVSEELEDCNGGSPDPARDQPLSSSEALPADTPSHTSNIQSSSNIPTKIRRQQFASQRPKSGSVSKSSQKDKTSDSGSESASGKTKEKKTPVKRHAFIEFDMMTLDEMVRRIVSRCSCATQFPMIRISEGKYMVGENLTIIFVRILRNHVMVRIGGGWDTLENYLTRHDPCRCQVHGKGGVVDLEGRRSSTSFSSSVRGRQVSEEGRSGLCVISSSVDSNKLSLASQKAVNHSRVSKHSSAASSSSSSSYRPLSARRGVISPQSSFEGDEPCEGYSLVKNGVTLDQDTGKTLGNSLHHDSHSSSNSDSRRVSCDSGSFPLSNISNGDNISAERFPDELCADLDSISLSSKSSNSVKDSAEKSHLSSNTKPDNTRNNKARRSLNFSSNCLSSSQTNSNSVINGETLLNYDNQSTTFLNTTNGDLNDGDILTLGSSQVDYCETDARGEILPEDEISNAESESSRIFRQIEFGLRSLAKEAFNIDSSENSSLSHVDWKDLDSKIKDKATKNNLTNGFKSGALVLNKNADLSEKTGNFSDVNTISLLQRNSYRNRSFNKTTSRQSQEKQGQGHISNNQADKTVRKPVSRPGSAGVKPSERTLPIPQESGPKGGFNQRARPQSAGVRTQTIRTQSMKTAQNNSNTSLLRTVQGKNSAALQRRGSLQHNPEARGAFPLVENSENGSGSSSSRIQNERRSSIPILTTGVRERKDTTPGRSRIPQPARY